MGLNDSHPTADDGQVLYAINERPLKHKLDKL